MSARLAGAPLNGCDCFHIAIDDMMRRSGQGRNLAQAVIELAGPLSRSTLEGALHRLATRYPLLTARLQRGWPFGLPHWAPRTRSTSIPLEAHCGDGSPDQVEGLLQAGLSRNLEWLRESNIRFDLIAPIDPRGGAVVAATWAHALLDAKGAELLLAALAEISESPGQGRGPGLSLFDSSSNGSGPIVKQLVKQPWRQRLDLAAASGKRLDELRTPGFRSLGGTKPAAGSAHWRIETLCEATSRSVMERAENLSGALLAMPFFLACAIRAHARVFRMRGATPPSFVVSLPVQTRRKGQRSAIFQNHVSILFFRVLTEQIDSLETIVAAVREQFAVMLRERLEESWTAGLELARRVPSSIYLFAVRRQFEGEITSFYHSYTGPFAPDLEASGFLGVPVRNAYHVPAVSQPPGTGLFIGQFGGRMNVTLSWREGALSEPEASQLLEAAISDLTGNDER